MDDLISRQAAIDALDVLCQEHRYKIPGKIETYSQYNEAWQDALDRAEGAIFNLPSAQPEQWIPCSERLPERGKDVLVTRDYDGREDCNKSCRYVEIASCYGEDDDPDWTSFSDEYKMHPKNHHVIAWRELPEPYSGRVENG